MLKLMGSAVLIAAGGLAGMYVAGEAVKRPVELKSMISAIRMLETEIIYTATPLAEAMNAVAQGSDRLTGAFFYKVAADLLQGTGCTAREAWGKSLVWYFERNSLKTRDFVILANLGRSLGASDRENQQKHIRLACEQLKSEAERAEAEAAKSAKMWNYLGFCGALVLSIILY